MSVRSVYPINQGQHLQLRFQLVPNNSDQFPVRKQEEEKPRTAFVTLKGDCANVVETQKARNDYRKYFPLSLIFPLPVLNLTLKN